MPIGVHQYLNISFNLALYALPNPFPFVYSMLQIIPRISAYHRGDVTREYRPFLPVHVVLEATMVMLPEAVHVTGRQPRGHLEVLVRKREARYTTVKARKRKRK